MNKARGILIPIGGNEEKGLEIGKDLREDLMHDYVTDGILYQVVQESGGVDANIIIIPTASSIQKEVAENYLSAFGKLGCTNLKVLYINSHKEANSEENLAALRASDCIMFSGGDQSKIVKHIRGTEFHKLLAERYQNEPYVIAGTSAGAMCMAKNMIAGGNTRDSLFKGYVRFLDGLSLIPELIIDTHFIKRGRFGRLTEAVAAYPKQLGIGLSEDTGIIIKDGQFKVIGSGMVVVFDPSSLSHNFREHLEDNLPMSMTDLTVHVLAVGDKYDLKTRRTCIMTVDEYRRNPEVS